MKEMNTEKIMELSIVFSSFKRLVMLYVIEVEPAGYTQIVWRLADLGIKIGSSELYKHLAVLLENELISKKVTSYLITSKGMEVIKLINNVPEESRNMKMGYVR